MRRSDSLRILAEWAGRIPSRFKYPPALSMAERDAQSHGLAAVRAVRSVARDTRDDGYMMAVSTFHETAFAISESKLAVRCALRAVGLKTL